MDSLDFGTHKWHVSMGGFIDQVHEAMNPSLMQRLFKDLQWKCKYSKIGTSVVALLLVIAVSFITYLKVPKFSDTKKLCCNLPKIQTKRPNL